MKQVSLADGFPIDLKRLIVTRMLIQASSGAGKSWALRRILEQSHGAVQHLVIDPEGEFFTLRERFDYVLAAKHGGETAAEPRIAGLLAERLLELNASAILDLYELKIDQRVAFVKAFLEAVIDAPRKLWHPALIIVDEAHAFCPEKGMGDAASAGAVKDLCTRGRKRGFAAILATQRLAKLAKDAAAECTNKLIGRTNLDVDLKRAADDLGFGKGNESWARLKQLGDGDFFAYGPAMSNEVRQVHVGPVHTTHPKVGVQLTGDAPPPTEKIKALLPKLSDLPAEQERKTKTEADLKAEIRSLKAQLGMRPKDAIVKVEEKRVEVHSLKDSQVTRLEAAITKAHQFATQLDRRSQDVVGWAEQIVDAIRLMRKENIDTSRRVDATKGAPWDGTRYAPVSMQDDVKKRSDWLAKAHDEQFIATSRTKVVHHPDKEPSGYALGLLKTLYERQPMRLTPTQLATLSARSSRSSAFAPAIRELMRLGLAEDGAGGLAITGLGAATLGQDLKENPAGRDDIIAAWRRALPPAELHLFDIVLKNVSIMEEDLASQAKRSRNSSAWRPTLRVLVRHGLITWNGEVVELSDTLRGIA